MNLDHLTDFELGWLAGLFEGEGCFSIQKVPNREKTVRYWAATCDISMSDLDCIERIARITGYTRNLYTYKKAEGKRMYRVRWHGEEAKAMMTKIKPYMCERRTARIEEVMANTPKREVLEVV